MRQRYVSERRRMIMDTEVETLPSKSTRQEGYVEAKHCLCIELLPDVNECATRIFAPQVRVSDHMLDSVLCINTINRLITWEWRHVGCLLSVQPTCRHRHYYVRYSATKSLGELSLTTIACSVSIAWGTADAAGRCHWGIVRPRRAV